MDVQLISKAITDAKGEYVIKSDEAAAGFYLVEANYQGAKYHAPVKPSPEGTAGADITVYDSVRQPAAIHISVLRVAVAAQGQKSR
jgi:hypothetical protein